MDKYNFSLAKHSDISEILDIYHSLIGTPGCTWDIDYPNREIVESDIDRESLYILKNYDKIIAVAAAGINDELDHLQWSIKRPCDLARIGVLPMMQNQGIGTIMLQKVIQAVKEKEFDGIRILVSKSNPAALALYNKNNFIKCGETFMYGIDFYCCELYFNTSLRE